MTSHQIVEIKVGQLWQEKGSSETYLISAITDFQVYARRLPVPNYNVVFVNVDGSGRAVLHLRWQIVNYMPRECKCGIYRGDCTYHK